MDLRDKNLHRLMAKRRHMARTLPVDLQLDWARRCVDKAASQQRNLFYILASIWVQEIQSFQAVIN